MTDETGLEGSGFEGEDDRIYVIAHNGNDKEGLWKFDLKTKSFGELVYRRDDVEKAHQPRFLLFSSGRQEFFKILAQISLKKFASAWIIP